MLFEQVCHWLCQCYFSIKDSKPLEVSHCIQINRLRLRNAERKRSDSIFHNASTCPLCHLRTPVLPYSVLSTSDCFHVVALAAFACPKSCLTKHCWTSQQWHPKSTAISGGTRAHGKLGNHITASEGLVT